MQSLKRDDQPWAVESNQESWHDESDDQPALDAEGVLACLDSDVAPAHDGDPVTGIRNGLVAGSLIWAIISATVVLLT